jgi:hypothetical protein
MSQLHNEYYQYSDDTDRLLNKYNMSHKGNCPEIPVKLGLKEWLLDLLKEIIVLLIIGLIFFAIVELCKSIFQSAYMFLTLYVNILYDYLKNCALCA